MYGHIDISGVNADDTDFGIGKDNLATSRLHW